MINMDEILQYLEKAEKAWLSGKKIADETIKKGNLILDTANKIEEEIKKKCEVAFPVNISFNNEAAHYSPTSNDTRIYNDEIVKIDFGCHSNGYIVDAAYTIDLSNKNLELKNASKIALESAIKYIKEEKENSKFDILGEIIENEIKKFGFKPIYNLTGHSMNQYDLHSGKSFYNYKTDNKNKIGTGIFAIEPFATNGTGLIKEGNFCSIYNYNEGNHRDVSIIPEIKNFNGLPFSERWFGKNVLPLKKRMAIQNLLNAKILTDYPVLIERDPKALISQHEKTIYIDKENIVRVFPNIDY